MHRIPILLLLLAAWLSLSAAASAPVFCKCTCFSTSYIIALSQPHDPNAKKPSPPDSTEKDKATHPTETIPAEGATLTSISPRIDHDAAYAVQTKLQRRAPAAYCSQCNRAFCKEQMFPGCKEAETDDFVAMCFQRDSRKDQIIVWGFILGTTGLLGWAAIRKGLEMREAQGFGSGLGGLGALGRNVRSGMGGGGGERDDGRRGSYLPVDAREGNSAEFGGDPGRPG